MHRLFHFVLISVMLTNCDQTPTSQAASSAATSPMQTETRCYVAQKGAQTNLVQFNITGQAVTGLIAWEEPGNPANYFGSFVGRKEGMHISADFTYTLQGKKITEEVYFEIAGARLLQADGEQTERDGKMIFKNKLETIWAYTFDLADCGRSAGLIDRAKQAVSSQNASK
jgi:hypothetical protein